MSAEKDSPGVAECVIRAQQTGPISRIALAQMRKADTNGKLLATPTGPGSVKYPEFISEAQQNTTQELGALASN